MEYQRIRIIEMICRRVMVWLEQALAPAILVGTFVMAASGAAFAAERQPNIVLAIADDWGWPHASAYGDRVVKTPTFDRVAREGVLFANAFVSSPSCTPSRGALITGQHFWRLAEGANLHSIWPVGRFAEYPQLLEDAGYFVGTYRKAWGPGRGSPAGTPYKSVDTFFEARPAGKPFCFWFGSQDPHRPYERAPASARAWTCRKCIFIRTIPTRRKCAATWPIIISKFSASIARWASLWQS